MCLPPPLVPFVLLLWCRSDPVKCPLLTRPFVLHLLDGPVGVDPAFHIVWTRFRFMRQYLAHRPLDVVAQGAPGHGPCASASFFCCGNWVCLGLESSKVGSPLRMLVELQHFQCANF